MLQHTAPYCNTLQHTLTARIDGTHERVAKRQVNILQHFAVCCSVLECIAACCSVVQCVAACCSVLQCVAADEQ